VTRSGTPAPELMNLLLAKCPASLADCLIRRINSAFEPQRFYIASAEMGPVVLPHAMAENLGGKAVVLLTVGAGRLI
jgi:hypothetical protein